MSQHTEYANQGHRYKFGDKEVISMGRGREVRVREILAGEPYPLGPAVTVKASWLVPLTMVYFKGETPK